MNPGWSRTWDQRRAQDKTGEAKDEPEDQRLAEEETREVKAEQEVDGEDDAPIKVVGEWAESGNEMITTMELWPELDKELTHTKQTMGLETMAPK